MKSPVFSKSLYCEALRQTRAAGLICSIISLGIALLTVLDNLSSALSYNELALESGMQYVINIGAINTSIVAWVPFVCVPVLMLILFDNFNRREGADFFHALAFKRYAIASSYLLAVLTWCAAATLLPTLLSAGAYALMGGLPVEFNASAFLLGALKYFVTCIYACGAMLIAVSITGTAFTNFVAATIIIFVPRLLIDNFLENLLYSNPVLVSVSDAGIFADSSLNVMYDTVASILSSLFGYANKSLGGNAIVYMLVVGIIYISLGIFLFTRRKSEIAAKSAPNATVQCIFRTLLAFLFCLPAISNILTGDFVDVWLSVLFIYALAVVVYFVYELITVKKPNKLKNALAQLPILVLLNIITITGVLGINQIIYAQTPATDEIESIVLPADTGDDYYYIAGGLIGASGKHLTIEGCQAAKYTIRDEKILTTVGDTLANIISNERSGKADSDVKNATNRIVVQLNLKNGETCLRKIYVSDAVRQNLINILSQDSEFVATITELPDISEVEEATCYELESNADALLLYECMKQEVESTLSASERYQLILDSYHYRKTEYTVHNFLPDAMENNYYNLAALEIKTNIDGLVTITNYDIGDHLPKTAHMFMSMSNKEDTAFEGIDDESINWFTLSFSSVGDAPNIESRGQYTYSYIQGARNTPLSLVARDRLLAAHAATLEQSSGYYAVYYAFGSDKDVCYSKYGFIDSKDNSGIDTTASGTIYVAKNAFDVPPEDVADLLSSIYIP